MCFIVLPRSPAPLPPSAPLINYCALTYAPLLACAQSHNLQHCTRGRTACIHPPSFLAHPRTFPLASSANDARCAILSHLDFTRNLGFIRHMSLHTDEKKKYFFNVSQVTLLVLRAVPHNWLGAILKGALLSSNSVLFEYTVQRSWSLN